MREKKPLYLISGWGGGALSIHTFGLRTNNLSCSMAAKNVKYLSCLSIVVSRTMAELWWQRPPDLSPRGSLTGSRAGDWGPGPPAAGTEWWHLAWRRSCPHTGWGGCWSRSPSPPSDRHTRSAHPCTWPAYLANCKRRSDADRATGNVESTTGMQEFRVSCTLCKRRSDAESYR